MKKTGRLAIFSFLAAEGMLYVWFVQRDLTGTAESVPVKYASILLCSLFTVLWAIWGGGDRLTAAAMVLTAAADTFLLKLNTCYGIGILLFCGVQLCYLLRILACSGRSAWGLRLILFPASLVALRVLNLWTSLNILALFYFTNFFCNTLCSLTCTGARFRLFSTGLVLFLCCDLCVAAFQFPEYLPAGLFQFVQVGMWLFYLPGQVFIALSAVPKSVS